jgi:hypothetical protein
MFVYVCVYVCVSVWCVGMAQHMCVFTCECVASMYIGKYHV